jgi:hypothetical protein
MNSSSNSSNSSGGFFNTLKKNFSGFAEKVTGAVNSAGKMISGNSAQPTSSGNAFSTVGMVGGKRKSRNMRKKSKKTRKNRKH